MKLSVLNTVKFPREIVFATMRDQMPKLSPYMPNVESITVDSRKELGEGELQLVNLWEAASTEIPAIVRPFISSKQMGWADHAHWKPTEWRCDWRLVMNFMSERIHCHGKTLFKETPRGCEMSIEGELELNLKGMVPRLMLRKVSSTVEGFVIKLLKPNFQKTADALSRYLEVQGG